MDMISQMTNLPRAELVWIGIGLAGQASFTARMLVQWCVSELRRESVVPIVFWYLSLLGGLTLLSYAIYRRDPVFILGQSAGVFIYVRNLMLIHWSRHNAAAASASQEREPGQDGNARIMDKPSAVSRCQQAAVASGQGSRRHFSWAQSVELSLVCPAYSDRPVVRDDRRRRLVQRRVG